MVKASVQLSDSLAAATGLVVTTSGLCYLISDTLGSIFPFALTIIFSIFGAIYYFHVPAPSAEQVEAIVGKELHLIDDSNADFAMKTVAHRGAGLDAPENSLAAFKMCKEKNCDAIEFDVSLTKDDVPVVFHDATLERMADFSKNIAEMKYSELETIDISVKHPFRDRFANTTIPTLDQTVNQLLESGQKMFIDLKDNNNKLIKIILDLFKKYPELYSKAVVSSFFPNLIYFIRRGDPKIVCSMAWRPYAFTYDFFNYAQGVGPRRGKSWHKHFFLVLCDLFHEWALHKCTYYLLGLSIILLHKDAISGKAVLDWRKKGIRVMAWTANSPAEKQYFARVLKITYLTDTLTGEGTTHSAA